MRHDGLRGAGRCTHREIDVRLPTEQEKLALRNLVDEATLELVPEGNTGFDQDGNWRLRIDGAGDLVVEVREGGAWVMRGRFGA